MGPLCEDSASRREQQDCRFLSKGEAAPTVELVAGPLCEDSASRRKQLGDLRHSIEKGAVEVQIKLICAALLCHSGGPMSRDKGPCTKGACSFPA